MTGHVNVLILITNSKFKRKLLSSLGEVAQKFNFLIAKHWEHSGDQIKVF